MRAVTIAIPLALLLVLPAVAAEATVSVHLRVDVHTLAPLRECDVTVPAGSNGRVVLAAAVAAGCIDSYEIREYSFGGAVRCIDGVCWACTPDATAPLVGRVGEVCPAYWAMLENGTYTAYGVDGFRAANGDVLQFSYEFLPLWVTYFLPVPLP